MTLPDVSKSVELHESVLLQMRTSVFRFKNINKLTFYPAKQFQKTSNIFGSPTIVALGGHANRFIFHGRFRSSGVGRTARVYLHLYRLRCWPRQRLEVPLPRLQKWRRSVPCLMLRYRE